jgi:ferrochelatase
MDERRREHGMMMSEHGSRGRHGLRAHGAARLSRHRVTGLILAGMGGPERPQDVGPFLRNLFRDPAVLPLPRPLGRLVGAIVAARRTAAVRERYRALGGGSPQRSWTTRQATRLAELLGERQLRVVAAPAMRYWHPFPPETVRGLLAAGAEQFLIVPAYPQYAGATTGSILEAVRCSLAKLAPGTATHVIRDWHLLPGYLQALVGRTEPILRRWARSEDPRACGLLPVAHSLPERFIRSGDPYLLQVRATLGAWRRLLADRLRDLDGWWQDLPGGGEALLAFQSKVGPVRWLGPDCEDEVVRLAGQGCRRLLVVPLSFTCEHIETLQELDISLAVTARAHGIGEYLRAAALNLDESWLASLADHLAQTAFAAPGNATTDAPVRVSPPAGHSSDAPGRLPGALAASAASPAGRVGDEAPTSCLAGQQPARAPGEVDRG